MLIVNADDWGRSKSATDCAAACYARGRISSASAMVFMEDSARGAELGKACGLDIGLHLNFSEDFTGDSVSPSLRAAQTALRRFLKANRFALLFYHPFLARHFSLVLRAQMEEFERLYGAIPSHLDGHQHMHLASNVLFDKLLPPATKVRRSFSFARDEKSPMNRAYRSLVDRHLRKRHRITDYFFALASNLSASQLNRIIDFATHSSVELMTHPEVKCEFKCLMSDDFSRLLANVRMGSYTSL